MGIRSIVEVVATKIKQLTTNELPAKEKRHDGEEFDAIRKWVQGLRKKQGVESVARNSSNLVSQSQREGWGDATGLISRKFEKQGSWRSCMRMRSKYG